MCFKGNPSLLFLFFCFCFGTIQVSAQENTLSWIKQHAYPLQLTASADYTDLRFLSEVLAKKTVVALGEASHGTEEFYTQKSRLVKYLVTEQNFLRLAMEADAGFIEPINQYILTGAGAGKDAFKAYGLYNSEALSSLVEWLRVYNQSQVLERKVQLLGVDKQDYWSDPLGRDSLMANDLLTAYAQDNAKTILWGHNLHLAKDITMSGYEAMGYHLAQQLGDSYYVVLLDTDQGNTGAIVSNSLAAFAFESRENTLAALLSKVSMDAFFVELGNPSSPFYEQTTLITTIYSNWQNGPVDLPAVAGRDYDAVLFIRKTSAAKPIE